MAAAAEMASAVPAARSTPVTCRLLRPPIATAPPPPEGACAEVEADDLDVRADALDAPDTVRHSATAAMTGLVGQVKKCQAITPRQECCATRTDGHGRR